MADIIPKEKLTAYQRLQFTSFSPIVAPTKNEPVTPPAEPSLPIEETEAPQPPSTDETALALSNELEVLREAARQAGYEAGYAEGQSAAETEQRNQTEVFLQHLAQLTLSAENSLTTLDQEVATALLDLSIEISQQVIRGTLSVNKNVLLPVIREAITLLPLHHGHVYCQIHPDDMHVLRQQIGEQLTQQGIQLVENSEITPGGCILKAGTSEIDATLETRWKRVLSSIGTEPTAWVDTLEA